MAVPDMTDERSSLSPSTAGWGDRFRAAYVQSKRHFPVGVVTYRAVAERVSQVIPTSDTTVMRLGYLAGPPSTPAQRQLAYLSLMAMGYDPLEFELEPRDRALRGMTDIELRKMLDPGKMPGGGAR